MLAYCYRHRTPAIVWAEGQALDGKGTASLSFAVIRIGDRGIREE
jgi:hypothetical protein